MAKGNPIINIRLRINQLLRGVRLKLMTSLLHSMKIMNTNTRRERHLYFLELRDDTSSSSMPRFQEASLRRAQALEAIIAIGEWLKRMDFQDKVSSLAATALGQVLITCEADVISLMLREEFVPVVAVRNGAAFVENLGKPLVGERLRIRAGQS